MKIEEQQISLEEALSKAFWMVKAPSMVVLLAPLLSFSFLAKFNYVPSIGYAGMKWAIPTFLVSFVGGWLVWSIQVPRWRLWAYRRVKDIAVLKDLAIEQKIIWQEGSFFGKTEIMSQKVRDELRRLEAMQGRG